MWVQLSPGVNFTNILWVAFVSADPKSAERHWWLDCLFVLLGTACIKAACEYVGEMDPITSEIEGQRNFYRRFLRTASSTRLHLIQLDVI